MPSCVMMAGTRDSLDPALLVMTADVALGLKPPDPDRRWASGARRWAVGCEQEYDISSFSCNGLKGLNEARHNKASSSSRARGWHFWMMN